MQFLCSFKMALYEINYSNVFMPLLMTSHCKYSVFDLFVRLFVFYCGVRDHIDLTKSL